MRNRCVKYYIFLFLILSLLFCVLASFSFADQYRSKTYGVQRATIQKESIEELEKNLENLDSTPYGKALALRNLANAYINKNEYEKAIDSLKQALATKALSKYAEQEILFQLAQLYLVQDQHKTAIDTLENLLQNDDISDPDIYMTLGYAYVETKKLKKAIVPIQKALKLSKDLKEDWYKMSLSVYYKLNMIQECTDLLNVMIQLFPEEKKYWLQLSTFCAKLEQVDKALAVLELAHKKNLLTSNSDCINLGRLFMVYGAPYKAGVFLNKAIKKGLIDKSPENYKLLTMAWMQAKERKLAIESIKKMIVQSDDDELYIWLCELYIETSNWKEAVKTLKIALQKANEKREIYDEKVFEYQVMRPETSPLEFIKQKIFNIHTEYKYPTTPLILQEMSKLYLLLGIAQFELSEIKPACAAFKKASQFGYRTAISANEWLDYLYFKYPEIKEQVEEKPPRENSDSGLFQRFPHLKLLDAKRTR